MDNVHCVQGISNYDILAAAAGSLYLHQQVAHLNYSLDCHILLLYLVLSETKESATIAEAVTATTTAIGATGTTSLTS